ncbi:MAG: hypothetical protein ACYT04_45600, partial [Nostoc sp.]
NIYALNKKGETLWSLGRLFKNLSQSEKAFQSYQAALIVFENSLTLLPDDTYLQNCREHLQQIVTIWTKV